MILSVDIGGTYIKYGYVTGDRVDEKGKFKTIFSFPELCRKTAELVKPGTERICISSGGFWTPAGVSLGYETIPEMGTHNLVEYLKNRYGIPVTIQNDARCALLCERRYGVLKGCKDGVLFVLGSSVGCAVLLDGKLYEGARKRAAMFFKMPERLDPYKYECHANTVVQSANYSAAFGLSACNMQNIEAFADGGEPKAREILQNYAQAVAKKLLFARLAYDPEKIVLGGGIVNSSRIFSDIRAEYGDLLRLTGEKDDVPIVKTAFGEDSNLVGAALEESEHE